MCKAHQLDMAALQSEVNEIVKACKGLFSRKEIAIKLLEEKQAQLMHELNRIKAYKERVSTIGI